LALERRRQSSFHIKIVGLVDMELLLVGLAGFCASLVDGALGMGFGPTSSSILLGTGLAPASVSTTVNLAKVATGVASAVSHWRFRNIDHHLVLRLALPGCVGAVVGVTVLSSVDGDDLKPVLSVLLVVIGLRILWRFGQPVTVNSEEFDDLSHDPDRMPAFDQRGVEMVAAGGGVTNGLVGAWGPVVTPFLMHRGLPPRFAVGSVNTAELAVATVSAASLITALGSGGLDPAIVLAMLLGGIVAAPMAAWVVRHVPPRPMGVAVAALLLLTNAREIARWSGLQSGRWLLYATLVGLVTVAAFGPRLRRSVPAIDPPSTTRHTPRASAARARWAPPVRGRRVGSGPS
jgi:uncharacterized membrane protein YfcA